MKKNVKIFVLVYLITFLGLVSLYGQTDIIKNERYIYITVDGDTIAEKFTTESKATLHGAYLHELYYPNKLVEMWTPNSRFSGKPFNFNLIDSLRNEIDNLKLSLENSLNAEIISIRYPSDKVWLLAEPLPNIAIGNGCDSLARTVKMISKENFDFKDEKVILNNVHWTLEKRLYNNGESITVIDALSQGLIEMMCPQDQVEITAQPLLGNVDVIQEGWSNNMDGSYNYDGLESYKYLVFTLNETLEIGDTVKITFDILRTEVKKPLVNLWLYATPGLGFNGGITRDISLGDGYNEFIYTIVEHQRFRFGIRARNNDATHGGAFKVSNIKIIRQ